MNVSLEVRGLPELLRELQRLSEAAQGRVASRRLPAEAPIGRVFD